MSRADGDSAPENLLAMIRAQGRNGRFARGCLCEMEPVLRLCSYHRGWRDGYEEGRGMLL